MSDVTDLSVVHCVGGEAGRARWSHDSLLPVDAAHSSVAGVPLLRSGRHLASRWRQLGHRRRQPRRVRTARRQRPDGEESTQ